MLAITAYVNQFGKRNICLKRGLDYGDFPDIKQYLTADLADQTSEGEFIDICSVRTQLDKPGFELVLPEKGVEFDGVVIYVPSVMKGRKTTVSVRESRIIHTKTGRKGYTLFYLRIGEKARIMNGDNTHVVHNKSRASLTIRKVGERNSDD